MVDARSGGSVIMDADIDMSSPLVKRPLAAPLSIASMGAPRAALNGGPLLTKGPLCSGCCAALPLLVGAPLQEQMIILSAN